MARYLLLTLSMLLLLGSAPNRAEAQNVQKNLETQPSQAPGTTNMSGTLLKDSIDVVRVEAPTEAILTWKRYREQKPTLVIMSDDPLLQPIPAELQTAATDLILKSSEEDFRNKAVYLRSNSILLHRMALSAALNAELFSKVIWILPTPPEVVSLTRDKILKTLKLSGYFSQKELDNLKSTENHLIGTFHKTPFILTSLNHLSAIDTPILLHLESSFFKPLYQSEVKTPLYGLVYNALSAVQSQHWHVEAVTASSFTLGGNNALSIRFLIDNIAQILKSPEMLNSPPPATWQYRSRAFYLDELMQLDKELETYLEMEKLSPDNASIQFALYEISRKLKKGNEALAYLESAVSIDRAYAGEYMNLAMTAFKKKNREATVKMLQKAEGIDPLNPFTALKSIPLYLTMGMPDRAMSLLKKLQKMTWSPVYDPEINKQFNTWLTEINRMKPEKKSKQ